MIICGLLPSDMDPKWGLAYALGEHKVGFNVGDFVYYENFHSQITDKKGNKLCLVSHGWVDKKKCRLKE